MSSSDSPTDPTVDAKTRDDGLADTKASTVPTPRFTAWELADYDLGDVIGRGGMGEVIAAHDRRIDREVAIKRMRAEQPSPEAAARFLREAKIQARLDHPAIVPVHELGTDPAGRPYFTMKRLVGTTLAQRLALDAPIQPLLRALVDVCFAVELAHTRSVVHRDLKPSNIMLGDYGDVYVLDWGIARVLGDARAPSTHLPIDSLPPSETAAGVMLGTPGYMAPEQIRGDEVGPAADVYALGAILFEILAGETLHPLGNPALASTLVTPAASPAHRRTDRNIAPELDTACVAALDDDPARRPSARALAEQIQRYLDGDRDLERRKLVARDLVVTSRASLATGDRRGAAGAAGRALALDPDSTEAIELVTKLILEPPRELPAELVGALADEERRIDRDRSRRAIKLYLIAVCWLPMLFWVHVASWPQLVGFGCAALAMAITAAINSRTARVPISVFMIANMVLIVFVSRVSGWFVLTPLVVFGTSLAFASRSRFASRPWLVGLWAAAALLLPFVLEAVGAIAPTWQMTPHGILSWGTIIDSHGFVDALGLSAANVAIVSVLAMYATVVARGRSDAQRRMHIQAWHLQQLLPRT